MRKSEAERAEEDRRLKAELQSLSLRWQEKWNQTKRRWQLGVFLVGVVLAALYFLVGVWHDSRLK